MNHTKLLVFISGLLLCASTMQSYASKNDNKLSPHQQLAFYQRQIDSAEQQRNVTKMALVYGRIVELCRNSSDLEDRLPENLYKYGMWSSFAGNHQEAISVLIELLDMQENQNNKSLFPWKAKANVQLGITYFFLELWDDALAYYQKAFEMAIKLDDKQGISIIENNIGNIYQKKGDYQQAIKQYQQSLQLQVEEDKEIVCNTYYNIATCYRESGSYEESFPYFNQALDIAKEIGETEIYALSLIELAFYNAMEKRQFDEAELQIAEAEKLAQEAGYKQVLKEIYYKRAQIEEEKGNSVSALDYYKKFKLLSDTLFNDHSIDKLHEYEVRYKTQEKELEILRQQTEINQHKMLQYIYIGGLIALGLLLVLLIHTIRLRNKRNKELKDINATKDKFFSIISHDLKNPAIAQRNALQMLVKNGNNWDTGILSQYYSELLKSADYQVELLYGLLDWAQVQTGRMPYKPISFDLANALRSEISMIRNMATIKKIELEVQMLDETIVTGDINMLTAVIRNLLTNAVKFTNEGGKVSLEITPSANGYTVVINDNGVGMSKEQLSNLFRIDSAYSKIGTAGEQGSGLGLIVCKELIEKHGSSLQAKSELDKGSQFWFEVQG